MDKVKNVNSNTDKRKEYKFYKKPSFKKKGPDVRQTKTSLARILKANPFLQVENKVMYDQPGTSTDVLKPVNSITSKLSEMKWSANGPCLRYNVNALSKDRLSSNDFNRNKPILSSTMIETSDDVFTKPTPQISVKTQSRLSGDELKKQQSSCELNKERKKILKTLSTHNIDKKKKEVHEISTENPFFAYRDRKRKRRPSSSDSIFKPGKYGCYTIKEEEDIHQQTHVGD